MKLHAIATSLAFFTPMLFNVATYAQSAFTDITETAGIEHNHNGFMYGVGIACGDFNNDGFLDFYLPNGKGFPNRLYLNNGNFTFREVASNSGLADESSEGLGTVCGDLDNDGDLDIYVANYFDRNKLYLNDGNANFTDATVLAGVGDPGPSTSVALADYDNDGYLDIYVLNRNQGNTNHPNRLYRNSGDGTFTDVALQANVGYVGTSLGAGFCDYDNDGDEDLYVVNEFEVDSFYRNNGDGTFSNIADSINLPIGEGMGVDFADYDNDGDFDIYVSNYLKDFLLKNNGDGTFTDVADQIGIINYGIGWGVNFFDFDNDGDNDVYIVNGAMIYESRERPNPLYRNDGDGTFTNIARDLAVDDSGDGRGSVCADFNNDGYVDLFFANVLRGRSMLYRNNGGNNNWITLKLEGTQSNRSAVGAKVEVEAGGLKQIDEVRAGSSYASMHPLDMGFGLGQVNRIDSITIYWPSGYLQKLTNVAVNQTLTVVEYSDVTKVERREDYSEREPVSLILLQNFPNPFNSETVIQYQLSHGGYVSLDITNLSGQRIRKYDVGFKNQGQHIIEWNGKDYRGVEVSSGIYFYAIIYRSPSGMSYGQTNKMLIVK